MRIAAVDVGSNSIHMVVAQVESDGRFHVLDRAKEMVRLGKRTLSDGRLPDEAIAAGIQTLSQFRTLAERQGVTRIKAVATSAVREAANGGDFIEQVEKDIGLRVKVIPGREEARLIYLGVRHAIDLSGKPALVADVGGGSLELIFVEDGKPLALESVKLGVARMSERFLPSDPPTSKEIAALEQHLAEELDPILRRLPKRRVRQVIGTSGTLLNLIAIAGHLRGEPPNGHLNNFAVRTAEIGKLRRLLLKTTRQERLRIKGLDAKRVDLIGAGACLADYLLRQVGAKQLVACTWALREGVLLDFIARHSKGIEENETYDSPRQRSVARLARHLGETSDHGAHTAHLALQLFDALGKDLQLGPETREILECSARLHDVGHHIDHKNHHRHSYYLIKNGELLGFRPDELDLIALTARYHRKSGPKDSDPEYGALPREARRTVRALSALLRVADALDRSHYSVVRNVAVSRRGAKLTLQLDVAGEDAALEMWDAQQRSGPLASELGLEVDFRAAS
jgi:exopolyphosphatase / guanosine-5'-triphosphate,3'-diphosphate pyrophosphatase